MRTEDRVDSVCTIQGAIEDWKPVRVFALYSGGHDSLVSTHFAMRHGAQEVLHINTGIGIARTREVMRENCKRYGWPLREVTPPQLDYLGLATKYGVPGPGAHTYSYVWLKERALDKVVRQTKTHRMSRVMFITGVRQKESARRMGHVHPIKQDGCTIWVAPMFDLSDAEVNDYMDEWELPRNPVKDALGMSGECLCGAYGDRARELPIIQKLDPQCHALIMAAEEAAREAGKPCEWGRARKARKGRSMKPKFMPLCVGCENEIEKAAWRREQ